VIIAGKCSPEKEALKEASERGFDHVELYLEKQHLDGFKESLKNCRTASVEIVSVHTPHVNLDNKKYFRKADRLASELGAYLVIHSQYIQSIHVPNLERIELISQEYGYENAIDTIKSLESFILDPGHELVLDTAHLFLSDRNYLESLEYLLQKHFNQVSVIHLCDSTKTEDGLGFGEGEMDMERVCQVIDESEFNGILVLEVMPEAQGKALKKWMSYTS
jgi:sugar phosphate isomerase/epimerase